MLIGAREIAHVEAVQPFEAGDGVGRDVLICVSDVRFAVRIRDGGGDVERIQ
ncbi:Uncharacterised protein [Mycobacteroides abscessus subsp. abscessus]|nr:Uncharacterised protein [Mycobacteroides abscessus subsp. abscessus]